MALSESKGYHAIWHPYDGEVLPVRLLYPHNYNPNQSYPLIVFIHGSNEMGFDNQDQLTWSIYSAFNDETQAFQDWPCFVALPQVPLNDHWSAANPFSFERQFHPDWLQIKSKSWTIAAILDFIQRIQFDNYIFYSEHDLSDVWDLPQCNINSNKIYAMGASLGGGACWSLAKEGRDVFAAIVNAMTWNCGTPRHDYYNESSEDYDAEIALRFRRECERIWHIPTIFIVGQNDDMYPPMQSMYPIWLDVVDEKYTGPRLMYPGYEIPHSTFISVPGAGHDIAVINSIFSQSNLFDVGYDFEQQYNNPEAMDLKQPMDYLFALDKQYYDWVPTDPYPNEEETYYPERSYAVISNDSVSNSIYTGQRTTIACDKTKDMKVRIAGVDTDVTFTNGYYEHVQNDYGINVKCFRLWDREIVGQVDKLACRYGGIFA
jgi:acetyl esterase/lipase